MCGLLAVACLGWLSCAPTAPIPERGVSGSESPGEQGTASPDSSTESSHAGSGSQGAVGQHPGPDAAPLPQPRPAAVAEVDPRYGVEVAVNEARAENGWFEMASILADRTTLPLAFESSGFAPADASLALVGRIEEGHGQPRLYWYSLNNTAFVVPSRLFHPASTVKLGATVAALMTLASYGLDGDTRVRFEDAGRTWDGPLHEVYREALLHSSNADYNRLMSLAGLDETNQTFLTPRWGLPNMQLMSRYGGAWRARGFRQSPQVDYWVEGERLSIPARDSSGPPFKCRTNCTTLFELHEIQRRLFLHEELPAAERFPLTAADRERMRAHMLRTRNRLTTAPRDALGDGVDVYNNVGRIPGTVLVENAYLHRPSTGDRVFVAVSIGFPRHLGDDTTNTIRWITDLCRASLQAALAAPLEGPGLQHAWGHPITLRLWHGEEERSRFRGQVLVPTAARVRVWSNRELVVDEPVTSPWHTFEFDNGQPWAHTRVLSVETWDASGEASGYRAFLVDLPGDGRGGAPAQKPVR